MANNEFEEQVKRFTSNLEHAKKEGDKYRQGDALENLANCYSVMPGHVEPRKSG